MFKSRNARIDNAIPKSAVDTLVAEDCHIKGDIATPKSIKIDGIIEGNIKAQGCVILGEKARVIGNISSAEMIIYGYLEGNIRADKAQLKNSCRIYGDIQAGILQVDHGAVYRGNVMMQEEMESLVLPEQTLTIEEKKIAAKKISEEKKVDKDHKG